MPVRGTLLVGLMLVLVAGACGSSGNAGGSGTHLDVEGVATIGAGLVPLDPSDPTQDPSDPTQDPSDPTQDPSDPTLDPSDPTPPVTDPEDAPTIDFSGSVDCDGDQPTGTGMFAATAAQVCADLPSYEGLLAQLTDSSDEVCGEIYGGPQHAKISGTIDGEPVDVSIDRADACGIEAWQSLEWLLGAPEQ